jgi:hypothetical protein
MSKLEKCGITFDSKIRFMCQFSAVENPKIVINSLKSLCKSFHIRVHTDKYLIHGYEQLVANGMLIVKEIDLPLICDLVVIGKDLDIEDRLKYAFVYKIWCENCGRLMYRTINCISDKVPRICEDCEDLQIDQGN